MNDLEIKDVIEIISKDWDLAFGARDCLMNFSAELSYGLSDDCIYENPEDRERDRELHEFVEAHYDEIEAELVKYINEHQEEILKKHNEREARMKEQVSSWTWEKQNE